MPRFTLAALLILLGHSAPTVAQFGEFPNPAPPAEFEARITIANDEVLEGKVLLASITIDCELGILDLKADKIRDIELNATAEDQLVYGQNKFGVQITNTPGRVVTTGGKILSGKVHFPKIQVAIDLGTLTLDPLKTRSITLLRRIDPAESREQGDPDAPPEDDAKPSRPSPIPRSVLAPLPGSRAQAPPR